MKEFMREVRFVEEMNIFRALLRKLPIEKSAKFADLRLKSLDSEDAKKELRDYLNELGVSIQVEQGTFKKNLLLGEEVILNNF